VVGDVGSEREGEAVLGRSEGEGVRKRNQRRGKCTTDTALCYQEEDEDESMKRLATSPLRSRGPHLRHAD